MEAYVTTLEQDSTGVIVTQDLLESTVNQALITVCLHHANTMGHATVRLLISGALVHQDGLDPPVK